MKIHVHRLPRLAAFFAALAAPVALAIDSIPEWEAIVARANGGRVPVIAQQLSPDADGYARSGCQWVEAYLCLARATGDGCHMDAAKDILDHILANRDDIRFAGRAPDVPYFYAPTVYLFNEHTPAPGWRRLSGDKTRAQVSVLIDGRVCEVFLRWCELARRSFPNYEPDIARYLDRIHETIEMHQPSFREIPAIAPGGPRTATLPSGGFHHWWHDNTFLQKPLSPEPRVFSGQLPLPHSAIMARAMLAYDRLRGTTAYREKVQRVINQFLNALDPARPEKAVWKHEPLNPARDNLEDLEGASLIVPLVESARRQGGFGVTADHIRRLVATYHDCFDPETGSPVRQLDGAGRPDIKSHDLQRIRLATASHGWLHLSPCDASLLDKARRTYDLHFSQGDSSGMVMAGWSELLYWEAVRGGVAVLPDRAPSL